MKVPAVPLANLPPISSAPNAAIGVLDSGVGGLSVLREIHRVIPQIPTIYFADQAHIPYGPRSAEEIRSFVDVITAFLIAQGASVIVIACHAASAASLYPLRQQNLGVPFVGMEPAVKPAAEATRSGVIAVLTTQATANGTLYKRVLTNHAASVRVLTQVAPELVTMVEQGTQDEAASDAIMHRLVDPLVNAGADQLVLACTHFPFLKEALGRVTNLPLVDPSAAVAREAARQVARVLPTREVSKPGVHRYFTSGDPATFRSMLRQLLDEDAEVVAASL